MTILRTILQKSQKGRWAVPHFNVSNLGQMRGVCEAAKALRSPVMIGTSEGERGFIGLKQAVALVKAFQKELGIPIFLNADHTHTVKAAKRAVDAGYDSIHIDLSKKSYKANAAGTREVVRYAKKKNPRINVEGELGYLVTQSSKIYKKRINVDPETFTKPEEAVKFVKETGVDRLAPAVGNLHGIAANRPKIDFALIKELRKKLPKRVALVLHGGSGNSPAAFKKMIQLGMNNIHISTELRLARTKALRKNLRLHPDELAPYKLSAPAVRAVRKKTEQYIRLFRSAGKANKASRASRGVRE